MEILHKLEENIGSWYKSAPRLPKEGQKWLAENVWWMVMIGVILGVLSILGTLSLTFLSGALLSAAGGVIGAAAGGLLIVFVILSLAANAIGVVLGALAISPLREMKHKGWTLLFVMFLAEAAGAVLSSLPSFNLWNLFWGLVWVAVWGYFLFEIRAHFGKIASSKPAVKK